MRGTNVVRGPLRHRRAIHARFTGLTGLGGAIPAAVEPDPEGVIYLTQDGEGYILYASQLPVVERA
jgi:hypothetical protein